MFKFKNVWILDWSFYLIIQLNSLSFTWRDKEDLKRDFSQILDLSLLKKKQPKPFKK